MFAGRTRSRSERRHSPVRIRELTVGNAKPYRENNVLTDNENWVIEAGSVVIQKMVDSGLESLTGWERLVYSLWVADYGMRNAGDLDTARDMSAEFQTTGGRGAEALDLPFALSFFSLSPTDFQRVYFDRFETLCDEIRAAEQTQ